jgi:hypothetical protein
MFLTAMNQAAGIRSTKAGTWIQAFFSKLMPATGANLTKSKELHNAALTQMGLIDSHGTPTWMAKGADGKTDWMTSLLNLSPILGGGLAKLPDVQRMQFLDDVFGKQGGREAGLFNLPEFIAQFPKLAEQIKNAKGGEDLLGQYGEGSPVQQGRQAFAELTAVLMDLSTVVLPPLTEALKDVAAGLKSVDAYLPKGSNSAAGGSIWNAIGKGAIEGGAIGAGIGFFTSGVGAVPGLLLGGATGGAYGAYRHLTDPEPMDRTATVGPSGTQPLNAASPPPVSQTVQVNSRINIDGREVARAVTTHQVTEGHGPSEGSPYPDTTRGGSVFDFSAVQP